MTRVLLVTMIAVMAGSSGCEHAPSASPDTPATAAASPDIQDVVWPYWPVRMRVHPLSRVTPDPELEQPIVEARLEFFDRDGNTTRCYGMMQLELNIPLEGAPDEPVSQWIVDLQDGQKNAEFFDPVTRTYLFKLDFGPDRDAVPDLLTVEYTGADGQVLTAEYVVPGEWGEASSEQQRSRFPAPGRPITPAR